MHDALPSPDTIPGFGFTLVPAFKPETLREQMRSAVARGLPNVSTCGAHEHTLAVAAGGPSLTDTYKELKGYVAAVNGSLAWLLDKGIVPNACGVCDPGAHMADIIEPHKDVTYYLASMVHPSVFDKLIAAGCYVVLWHVAPLEGIDQLLNELYPKKDWLQIGGGSTMGLRWLNLGYICGFRKFDFHGLDSSFRIYEPYHPANAEEAKFRYFSQSMRRASHAYPDHQDDKEWMELDGYQTKVNFVAQVIDFIKVMDRYIQPDIEPVDVRVFGEGLLQKKWAEWKAEHPGMHEGKAKPALFTDDFVWPAADRVGAPTIRLEAGAIERFMKHIHKRGVAVQAGGNVGIYPAHLARYFDEVHTFEPDPENYACLSENVQKVEGKIAAYNAALGASDGFCSTWMTLPHNCGAVRIIPDSGTVPVRTIDDLDLDGCDLIWLDVEGYELNALKGAEVTVERFLPTIIIEENELSLQHGLPLGGARQWLEWRGYRRHDKAGNDVLFLPPLKPIPVTEEGEKAKYEKAWSLFPEYRIRSPGENVMDLAIERMGMKSPESVCDFGCGPGRATQRFADLGFAAAGLDIADNCLDPGLDIAFRQVCLWDLPANLPQYDWGFCCDVMEHIPPERVDDVLAGIRRSTGKGAFFQVAFVDDLFGPYMGMRLHLTIRDSDWWAETLRRYWSEVELIWPMEKEIGVRGVFACKP